MKNFTVWSAVYNVLRAHNMTTMFGNPGSTEQPMLMDFPSDFQYILGLQEASVVGMADGYSQITRQPVAVSLHSSAGPGNGFGLIQTAWLNKSPLVIIAGTQTRQMLIGDPYLTNRDPTKLLDPWIKWSYMPVSAEEVPAAFSRAIAAATMPPMGPVFLTIPMDDWNVTADAEPVIRTVSTTVAPDPVRLADFASRVAKSQRLALVYGEEVDQSQGWDAGVALAEMLQAPVFQAPLSGRGVFPANNPLYKGSLPIAQGPIGEVLKEFDMVLVIGAQIFRYYPWSPGPVLQPGTQLLQITNSPHDAASARVGDSMLSDAKLALEALYPLLKNSSRPAPYASNSSASASVTSAPTSSPSSPSNSTTSMMTSSMAPSMQGNNTFMTPIQAFSIIAQLRQPSDILVTETPSNLGELLKAWPIVQQETYFTSSSGYLGWGLPAAVGVAIGDRTKTVVAVIGDGSTQYSVQALYSAVQHKAKVIFVVPRNEEYAILKEFAEFQDTPGCPGLNIPGIQSKLTAESYGMKGYSVYTPTGLYNAFKEARTLDGPSLIEVQITREYGTLPV